MSTGYYPDNYNSSNSTIIVRAYVTEIAANAFKDFPNLTTITFESDTNLLTIGDYAFAITSTTIIGIFRGNIFIPSSVTTIGNYAFLNNHFESITFNSYTNLLTIGDYAFSGISIRTVIGNIYGILKLPSSVTSLGIDVFSSVVLDYVDFNNCKITEIPTRAFYGSSIQNPDLLLQVGNIPNTVTKIGNSAFDSFISLDFSSNVYIPSGITYIGDFAYVNYGWDSNTTFFIPSSVTYLGTYVFDSPKAIINYSVNIHVEQTDYPSTYIWNAPGCFLVNTKILTMQSNNKEKYVHIQNLRKGDLVKTADSGYKKIDVVGYSMMDHQKENPNKKNRLYVCSTNKYPDLFDDLVITGCHSILVNQLTGKQRAETMAMTDRIYVTGNHYRLFACLDEKTTVYPTNGEYEIWHFALENDNEKGNYGVYANGLLVESCSKRTMHEFSGMQFV